MPMAIGVVTDLPASEARMRGGAPSRAAMPTAVPTAVSEPATRARAIGTAERRTRSQFSTSGMASATVAGPSRKWTNCAPSK